MSSTENRNLLGVFYMVLHTLALAVVYTCVKYITSNHSLSSSALTFIYKLILFFLTLPWILSGGVKILKTKRLKLHLLRGLMSICGSLCLFFVLSKDLPTADVASLQRFKEVILLAIGLFFFKEQFSKTKVIVVLFVILGAVLIAYQKDLEFDGWRLRFTGSISEINPYYFFIILLGFFYSMNEVLIKMLGRTERTRTQFFYSTLVAILFSPCVAFVQWDFHMYHLIPVLEPVSFNFDLNYEELLVVFPYILLCSLAYLAHTSTIFHAYKNGDVSFISPFECIKIVFLAVSDAIFIGEPATLVGYLGYTIIASSSMLSVGREVKRKRRKKKEAEENMEMEI